MLTKASARCTYIGEARGHSQAIFHGDASAFLRDQRHGMADVVFLDPPFNIGKNYGLGDFPDLSPEEEYLRWLIDIVTMSAEVLKPGGTLFIYHMPSIAYRIAACLEGVLTFRHWIAIAMKNTFARGRKLYPAHYALLYFTKGEPVFFTRPRITAKKCRHCGGIIRDYGGYRKIIEEKGINLSDFWDDISPLRHGTTKSRRANELPPTIFARIMAIAGAPGATYIDPFMGSGGGIIAASKAHMNALGCDASLESCTIAAQRLKELHNDR